MEEKIKEEQEERREAKQHSLSWIGLESGCCPPGRTTCQTAVHQHVRRKAPGAAQAGVWLQVDWRLDLWNAAAKEFVFQGYIDRAEETKMCPFPNFTVLRRRYLHVFLAGSSHHAAAVAEGGGFQQGFAFRPAVPSLSQVEHACQAVCHP